MKKIVLTIALAITTMYAAFAAEIIRKVDYDTLASIMRSEGYTVSRNSDKELLWTIDGIKCTINLQEKETSCIYFRCSYTYTANDDNFAKLVLLSNQYNTEWIYGKSYVNQGGECVVYMREMNMTGGVTRQNLKDFFSRCVACMKDWKEKVVDKL